MAPDRLTVITIRWFAASDSLAAITLVSVSLAQAADISVAELTGCISYCTVTLHFRYVNSKHDVTVLL